MLVAPDPCWAIVFLSTLAITLVSLYPDQPGPIREVVEVSCNEKTFLPPSEYSSALNITEDEMLELKLRTHRYVLLSLTPPDVQIVYRSHPYYPDPDTAREYAKRGRIVSRDEIISLLRAKTREDMIMVDVIHERGVITLDELNPQSISRSYWITPRMGECRHYLPMDY